jgi:hypothetical protein
MRTACSALLIIVGFSASQAQEYPRTEVDLSKITDDLVGFQDEDVPYEEIYENYLHLFSNPVNLNKASADQLRQMNILTENQIRNLLLHINRHGTLLSVYELQSVDDFDLPTLQRLAPFVFVTAYGNQIDADLVRRIYKENNTYLVGRVDRTLERSDGFKSKEGFNSFTGSPEKLYMRFRSFKTNDFSYGFTIEKDAGEKMTWDPGRNSYGFDYLSYHLQLLNKRKIVNLILGDFQFQFGQGLILGNSFGLGKGGETITTIRRANTGFAPYTSANESGNLRGVAGTFRLNPNLFLSTFYSNTKRDASVYYDDDPSFSSIITSGLHRTYSELGNRKTLGERCYGAVVNYKFQNTDAGIIYQATEYDFPMIKQPSAYNQFAFRGRENHNAGLFFNYLWSNVTLFGEAAKTIGSGYGFVGGLLASLSREFDLALLYRNYGKDFYPFYGNSLSESTVSQNESGFYWGLKYRFNRKYSAAAYTDIFQFPWLKFRTYAPTKGNEVLLRINYQPSRKTALFLQFRQEMKPRNTVRDVAVYTTATATKRNLTVNCDYEVSSQVKLKTRGQFSSFVFEGATTTGMTLLQDIVFSIGRFEFAGRHAIFDTDNFENRQYVYERDVWLGYALPAYEGWGVKNYAMVEYKVNRNMSVAGKYSRISFKDRDEIGSGGQKISGNIRNDIKLQFVLRF